MKCIVFTAAGQYARFRRPYTTTSALTFSLLHPVAARGLIAAVMGISCEDLYDYTADMKVAIQVLEPVCKDMQSFNLIAQANNNGAPSFQSRVEFLRDVKYRLFISDTDEKLQKLQDTLQRRSFVFTPYLGCSEHVARLNYEGTYQVEVTPEAFADTVVPAESVQIDESSEFTIYADRIPIRNNSNRDYTEYLNVMFSNQRLNVKELEIYKAGEYNVVFL